MAFKAFENSLSKTIWQTYNHNEPDEFGHLPGVHYYPRSNSHPFVSFDRNPENYITISHIPNMPSIVNHPLYKKALLMPEKDEEALCRKRKLY